MFFKMLHISTRGDSYFSTSRKKLKGDQRVIILKKDINNNSFNRKKFRATTDSNLSLVYKTKYFR